MLVVADVDGGWLGGCPLAGLHFCEVPAGLLQGLGVAMGGVGGQTGLAGRSPEALGCDVEGEIVGAD